VASVPARQDRSKCDFVAIDSAHKKAEETIMSTDNATNLPGASNLKPAPPTYTTTCILPKSMKPDVVVVVGGQEFREFSQSLACWSSYFDAAFRSGMKECINKRFEFPNQDPAEWQWLVGLMAPLPTETIDTTNVIKALAWFDLLCVDRGLILCDGLLAKESESGSNLHPPLDVLETSLRYNLPRSKMASCQRMATRIRQKAMTSEDMERLVSCIQTDPDCREALWGSIRDYMPAKGCEDEKDGGDLPQTISIPLHLFLHLQIHAGSTTLAPKKKSVFDSSSDEESVQPKKPAPRPGPRPAPMRRVLDSSDDDSDSD
jgi:BTB/POZ domain